jgi:hypothetical protein
MNNTKTKWYWKKMAITIVSHACTHRHAQVPKKELSIGGRYLKVLNCEEENLDLLRESLVLSSITGYTAAVCKVVEEVTDFLQPGLGYCHLTQAPKNLGPPR